MTRRLPVRSVLALMSLSRRMLAFVLLPLLAAGVGGLRWGHVAFAHGDAEVSAESTCSHRAHGSCSHSHGRLAIADDRDDVPSPEPLDDGCLDCDLLAVMVGGTAPEVAAAFVSSTLVDRMIARDDAVEGRASGVHRARPPPIA
ncbi:MAG: hypothetical protein ACO38W_13330 [Phycisphaerales bacterium]